VTGFQRSELLNSLADLIEEHDEELAELESLNNGKPVHIARSVVYAVPLVNSPKKRGESRDFDIADSVQCLRYFAGWADKVIGQVGQKALVIGRSLT
jgi:aldehyde dehydrogenase (NAD+)